MSTGEWFQNLTHRLRPAKKRRRMTEEERIAFTRQVIATSDMFCNLPEENTNAMLEAMETVEMKTGDAIVRAGEEGDYYYVLVEGTCTVSRCVDGETSPTIVAELAEGAGIGEEALISNAKRNATVSLKTDGILMRLSKSDFNECVKEPLVAWLSPTDARRKVVEGAKWLDVRSETGTGIARLAGAVVVPLDSLREQMETLDKDSFYVCYCQNGRQSSTAAFLLMLRGYDVAVMRGGLHALERAGNR